MKYYIADLHFGHENLLHYMDRRPFSTTSEMNETIISRWNEKVGKRDEVYILGDLSLLDTDATNDITRRLKGKLHLILGNHDAVAKKPRFDTTRFVWIHDYREITDEKRNVVLSHYPMICYNRQYDPRHETYMLYGHVHNSYDEKLINDAINLIKREKRYLKGGSEPVSIPCNLINCFCGFADYTPLTLDEWIHIDSERRKGPMDITTEPYQKEAETTSEDR